MCRGDEASLLGVGLVKVQLRRTLTEFEYRPGGGEGVEVRVLKLPDRQRGGGILP